MKSLDNDRQLPETGTEKEREVREWPFLAAKFAEERKQNTAQATCQLSLAKSALTLRPIREDTLDDCWF